MCDASKACYYTFPLSAEIVVEFGRVWVSGYSHALCKGTLTQYSTVQYRRVSVRCCHELTAHVYEADYIQNASER
jgi:hypothetical protein